MIAGTGCGLLIVIIVYILSFLSVSIVMPTDTTSFIQTVLIVITCVVSTIVNYMIARMLNKKKIKHTVYGLSLEKVVLFIGVFLLFLALMMLGGAIKDLIG